MNHDEIFQIYEEDNFRYFREFLKKRKVILFGSGAYGEKIFQYFQCCNIKMVAVVDNDVKKQGKKWHNHKIQALEDIKELYADAIFIVANASHYEEMTHQLIVQGTMMKNIIVCSEIRAIDEAIIRCGRHLDGNKFFHYDYPMPLNMRRLKKELIERLKSVYYKLLMNIQTPQEYKCSKKYKVSICAIFKNEASYLVEWLEYHKIVGVEHFYLYNNFSTDNYLEILEPYLKNGTITLIDWPVPQGQISAYQNCFDNYSQESQWIGLIDIDEFVTPIETNDIYAVLQKFEHNRGSVLIYWRMFTSSGIIHRDINNLVTEDFTICIGKHYSIGKCFINTSYSPVINQKHYLIHHDAWTTLGNKILPPVNVSDIVSFTGKMPRACKGTFSIQINHYNLKSYDEYVERGNKGDVFFKSTFKTNAYFKKIDQLGDTEDRSAYKYMTELKRQLHRD